MLREDPIVREPIAAAVAPAVRADRPNYVWHIDLSAVPTRLGFWVPWRDAALPQEWPFCWWVVVVLDHFSRRVQGFQVCERKPDAQAWYNTHRPHRALAIRTPDEVYNGLSPACEDPRLELRARWPPESKCATPQARVDRDGPDEARLEVSFLGGRRHLPIVSLRAA